MNYFITGIGTNVGKTIIAAIFTEKLNAHYWKPIQSGAKDDSDTETVKSLITNTKTIFYPETYLLQEPLSPHFAAKLEDVKIDLEKIINQYQTKIDKSNDLIIEGAGGILVPINDKEYVINIAKKIDCEIILVISSYLGCINHSLLSIDYLIKNKFKINALVFNGEFENEVKDAIVNYHPTLKIINIPALKSIISNEILRMSNKIKD